MGPALQTGSVHTAFTWTTALVFLGGFLSGVMAALLGVGGAVITTPCIRFLGATPIAAVGSTVPAILPGALAGALRFHREGYVNWRVVRWCGGTGMVFAVLGGFVADVVDAGWLMIVTAVLVMWSGVSLVRNSRRQPAASRAEPEPKTGTQTVSPNRVNTRALIALGACAGFLAGLLGIGGGLILTPGLTLVVRLPVKHAIATSLSAVALMSVTALVTHVALGHVDWRFALPLALGIVPGARVGSRFTVAAHEETVGRTAGGLLVAVAIIYLATEIHALAG